MPYMRGLESRFAVALTELVSAKIDMERYAGELNFF
jgi:hypothetical protein